MRTTWVLIDDKQFVCAKGHKAEEANVCPKLLARGSLVIQCRAGPAFPIAIIDEPVLIYRQDEEPWGAGAPVLPSLRTAVQRPIEDGHNIRCMYHGLKLNPAGECIKIPGQGKIPDAAKVAVYPLVSRHSWI